MESYYEKLPIEARRLHMKLPEASRVRRETLWKTVGFPWERMRSTQGTPLNALRRHKLNLLERLDVRRRKILLMSKI